MIPNFFDWIHPFHTKEREKGSTEGRLKLEKKTVKRVQVDTGDAQAIRL